MSNRPIEMAANHGQTRRTYTRPLSDVEIQLVQDAADRLVRFNALPDINDAWAGKRGISHKTANSRASQIAKPGTAWRFGTLSAVIVRAYAARDDG